MRLPRWKRERQPKHKDGSDRGFMAWTPEDEAKLTALKGQLGELQAQLQPTEQPGFQSSGSLLSDAAEVLTGGGQGALIDPIVGTLGGLYSVAKDTVDPQARMAQGRNPAVSGGAGLLGEIAETVVRKGINRVANQSLAQTGADVADVAMTPLWARKPLAAAPISGALRSGANYLDARNGLRPPLTPGDIARTLGLSFSPTLVKPAIAGVSKVADTVQGRFRGAAAPGTTANPNVQAGLRIAENEGQIKPGSAEQMIAQDKIPPSAMEVMATQGAQQSRGILPWIRRQFGLGAKSIEAQAQVKNFDKAIEFIQQNADEAQKLTAATDISGSAPTSLQSIAKNELQEMTREGGSFDTLKGQIAEAYKLKPIEAWAKKAGKLTPDSMEVSAVKDALEVELEGRRLTAGDDAGRVTAAMDEFEQFKHTLGNKHISLREAVLMYQDYNARRRAQKEFSSGNTVLRDTGEPMKLGRDEGSLMAMDAIQEGLASFINRGITELNNASQMKVRVIDPAAFDKLNAKYRAWSALERAAQYHEKMANTGLQRAQTMTSAEASLFESLPLATSMTQAGGVPGGAARIAKAVSSPPSTTKGAFSSAATAGIRGMDNVKNILGLTGPIQASPRPPVNLPDVPAARPLMSPGATGMMNAPAPLSPLGLGPAPTEPPKLPRTVEAIRANPGLVRSMLQDPQQLAEFDRVMTKGKDGDVELFMSKSFQMDPSLESVFQEADHPTQFGKAVTDKQTLFSVQQEAINKPMNLDGDSRAAFRKYRDAAVFRVHP